MRRELLAAAALATLIGGAAGAQVNDTGPYRRFTDDVGDVNRSNRIVYAPVGWAFPERRPGRLPYDVASATWYLQPVGTAGAKPGKVLDKATYTLDRFDVLNGQNGSAGMLRVVITRIGGEAEPSPELRVVDPQSNFTARASAQVEPVAGGSRYTFLVRPPDYVLTQGAPRTNTGRYELRFMSSREITPATLVARTKPTFGGEDPRLRALAPPPQLPRAERVAGRRIEYRSPRSAGFVVEDTERVAGRRQQFRDKR